MPDSAAISLPPGTTIRVNPPYCGAGREGVVDEETFRQVRVKFPPDPKHPHGETLTYTKEAVERLR